MTMAEHKLVGQNLVGQNYATPDLVAKVTGQSKYAEDFRADGMLFAKLLLSPLPHARVTRLDVSAALAMPGVKAIVTADDLPKPSDSINDNGQVIFANLDGEVALTNEPVYQGPWCAVVSIGAGNVTWDCHYNSFEECAPNVIAGNRGFCNRNPRWPGYYQPPKHHHDG